jgi:hypothetical protein
MPISNRWRAGLLFALLCLANRPVTAQEPEVKTLTTKDLAGAVGQEALVLMVEYAPGVAEPVHRHNAGRNLSQTKRARFVVFLLKEKGAAVAVPAR